MEQLTRITAATLDVLQTLHTSTEDIHGFSIVTQTGRAGGTVYPMLARLEKAGWVEGRWEREHPEEGKPRRRFYRLTREGRAATQALLAERRS